MKEKHTPGTYLNSQYNYSKVFLPRPINTDEAEKILEVLTRDLPANINYEITKKIECSRDGKSKNLGGHILEGKIFLHEDKGNSYDFTFINTGNLDLNSGLPKKLDTLWFAAFSVPEKESQEYHSPKQIKLWEDSRRIIEQYFKEN